MSQNDKKIIKNTAGSNAQATTNTKTIFSGVVVSDEGDQRLRVRLKGIDKDKTNIELPLCHPLIPKFFHMTPRKGEVVRVLLSDVSKPHEGRLWVGPVITQYEHLNGQPYGTGEDVSVNDDLYYKMNETKAVETLPDASDVHPNRNEPEYEQEVRLMSRGNVDIVMRDESLVIRAGKHEKGNKGKKNRKNPAYISVNFSKEGDVSSINLVGDMINLVTHQGNPVMHDLKNGKVEDRHHKEMEREMHPVPYGDLLVDVLGLMIKVLCEEHKHPYNGQPAVKSPLVEKLMSVNLETLKSKGIKIN
jgi:hypothetical protein